MIRQQGNEGPLFAFLAKPAVPAKVPGTTASVIFGGPNQRNSELGYLRSAVVEHYQADVADPAHTHRGVTMLVYVLAGEIQVYVNGVDVILRQGDTAVIEPGDEHYVRAGEQGASVFSAYVAAPGHENDPNPWLPVENPS